MKGKACSDIIREGIKKRGERFCTLTQLPQTRQWVQALGVHLQEQKTINLLIPTGIKHTPGYRPKVFSLIT